jgi:hypothetical protein
VALIIDVQVLVQHYAQREHTAQKAISQVA